MEGSKCAGAAAASLPGVCPPPGSRRASRRTDQYATRSPGDSAQDCEAGGRDLGRAAASGSGAVGEGRLGKEEWGGLRGRCGPGG